jgi:hypothetical protein
MVIVSSIEFGHEAGIGGDSDLVCGELLIGRSPTLSARARPDERREPRMRLLPAHLRTWLL